MTSVMNFDYVSMKHQRKYKTIKKLLNNCINIDAKDFIILHHQQQKFISKLKKNLLVRVSYIEQCIYTTSIFTKK